MSRKSAMLGLGNVLLDLALPVTDEEFEALRLPVPRGQVLRVTPEAQAALLAQFPAKRVTRYPGGSCANALRAFAWHGLPAKLLGLAGDDDVAEFLFREFRAAGVDITGIKRIPGHATDCCLALVTPDGERTMLPMFDAGAQATAECFQADDLDGYDCLHLEGYNLRFPKMLQAVLTMATKRRISWDMGDVSLIREHRAELTRIFRSVRFDCLFANRAEALEFTQCPSPQEAVQSLGTLADCAVVTDGARGAWVATCDMNATHIPAVRPKALVDTIGAGDSFQGAFLAARYSGAAPDEAARHAADFAAQVIALPGATMPTRPPKS
ncbi:MAG: adenosine kinase [Victivallales bacterium]|nr:adenosine kinase [Victivallales bacterium]